MSGKPVLHVYITHFQALSPRKETEKKRKKYLATCLFSLSQISNYRIKATILTNRTIDNLSSLIAPFVSRYDDSTVEEYVVPQQQLQFMGNASDWALTWAHKSLMLKDLQTAITRQNKKDLFLALEDDALFSQSNIDYYLQEEKALDKSGLIPAFMRQEWSTYDSCWVHTDSFSKISESRALYPHPVDSEKLLMQLPNPFCALILFNIDKCIEYFNSESCRPELAINKNNYICDLGSAASLGLIMEKIPEGFANRVAVVCNGKNFFPIPGAIYRHLGDKYAQDKWHRNFRIYDSDYEVNLPTHRRAVDYMFRLVKRDRVVVLGSFLQKLHKDFRKFFYEK
jgi:hypothetical protein